MTIHVELDEEAEIVHLLVDDHLSLTAERRTPEQIVYRNFDALIDEQLHDAVKAVAIAVLGLTEA